MKRMLFPFPPQRVNSHQFLFPQCPVSTSPNDDRTICMTRGDEMRCFMWCTGRDRMWNNLLIFSCIVFSLPFKAAFLHTGKQRKSHNNIYATYNQGCSVHNINKKKEEKNWSFVPFRAIPPLFVERTQMEIVCVSVPLLLLLLLLYLGWSGKTSLQKRRLTKGQGFPWKLRRRVALLEIIYLEAESIWVQRGGGTQCTDIDMARRIWGAYNPIAEEEDREE